MVDVGPARRCALGVLAVLTLGIASSGLAPGAAHAGAFVPRWPGAHVFTRNSALSRALPRRATDIARALVRADPARCLASSPAVRARLASRARSSHRPEVSQRILHRCASLKAAASRELKRTHASWAAHPERAALRPPATATPPRAAASSFGAPALDTRSLLLGADSLESGCTTTWTGGAGDGAWGSGGNWSTDDVPSADAVVCIPAGATVTVSASAAEAGSIQADGATVTLTGGSLAISQDSVIGTVVQSGGALSTADLLITDALNWTGGTMLGAGTTTLANTAAGAVTTTQGAAAILLDGHSLVNDGTLTIDCSQATDPTATDGLISGVNGAVLSNLGTMTLAAYGDEEGCAFQQLGGVQSVLQNSGDLQFQVTGENSALDEIGWTFESSDSAVVTDDGELYTELELYAGNGPTPLGGTWSAQVGLDLQAGGTYTFASNSQVSSTITAEASPDSSGDAAIAYDNWIASDAQPASLSLGDVSWPNAAVYIVGGQSTIGDGAQPVVLGTIVADEWTSEETQVTLNEPEPTDDSTNTLCDAEADDGATMTISHSVVDGESSTQACTADIGASAGGTLTVNGSIMSVDGGYSTTYIPANVGAGGGGAHVTVRGSFTGMFAGASNATLALDGSHNMYWQAEAWGSPADSDTAPSVLYQSGDSQIQALYVQNGTLSGAGTTTIEPSDFIGPYGGSDFEVSGDSALDAQTLVVRPGGYFDYEPVHANGDVDGQLTGGDGATIKLESGFVLGLGPTGYGSGPLVTTEFNATPTGAPPLINTVDGTLVNESATTPVDVSWDYQDDDPSGTVGYGERTGLNVGLTAYAGFEFAGATTGPEFTDGSNPGGSNPGGSILATNHALAFKFMPILDFSSEEKWRPLNVDQFFADDFGSAGRYGPYNQICGSTFDSCTPITSAAQLANDGAPGDYLEFDNVAPSDHLADPDYYQSPDADCVTGGLLDCDTGPASSIYYNVVGPSPTGLYYIEYWIFYRYNQGPDDAGNHVGDWEGVTVAPTADDNGLAFVELSQHGTWESYLVNGLTCGAATGACSVADAETDQTHVDDYPASGTHSDYPYAGAQRPGLLPDGNDNGEAPWGNDLVGSALIAMPATTQSDADNWTAGPKSWTDWPGAWGDTPQNDTEPNDGSPCGPAAESGVAAAGHCGPDHSGHYFAPWDSTGAANDCQSGPCPDARRAAPSTAAARCASWFGAGVAAGACDPDVIGRAVTSRSFNHRRASFKMWRSGSARPAASAPGIAQLIGVPLHARQRLVLSGRINAGTEIAVQAQHKKELTETRFRVTRTMRGRLVLCVYRSQRSGVRVVATEGASDLTRQTSNNRQP